MKMLKRVLLATLLLVVTVTLTGCKDKGIVGTWEYKTGGYTYTFNEDGTGTYDVAGNIMNFKYTIDGANISFKYTDEEMETWDTTFSITDDVLNIKDSLGEDTLYKKEILQ